MSQNIPGRFGLGGPERAPAEIIHNRFSRFTDRPSPIQREEVFTSGLLLVMQNRLYETVEVNSPESRTRIGVFTGARENISFVLVETYLGDNRNFTLIWADFSKNQTGSIQVETRPEPVVRTIQTEDIKTIDGKQFRREEAIDHMILETHLGQNVISPILPEHTLLWDSHSVVFGNYHVTPQQNVVEEDYTLKTGVDYYLDYLKEATGADHPQRATPSANFQQLTFLAGVLKEATLDKNATEQERKNCEKVGNPWQRRGERFKERYKGFLP